MADFACQSLNRDIWKDAAVRALVKEHFLFLQFDKISADAAQYITFYLPGNAAEDPDTYPHVSVVDPRTGEQVKAWSGRPFPNAAQFHSELCEFLERYSLDNAAKNPVAKQRAPKRRAVDLERMTDEEMMELAMKNSMDPAAGGASAVPAGRAGSSGGDGSGAASGEDSDYTNGSGSNRRRRTGGITDPDELTRSPILSHREAPGRGRLVDLTGDDDDDVGAGTTNSNNAVARDGHNPFNAILGGASQGNADANPLSPATAEAESLFASISSTNPHVEPPTSLPPSQTTRIQFRHANGRVIRRFRLTDSVRSLYEWLKAEPLEGREKGVEFELKVMPGGRDLIQELDKNVEEAGLKMGTVVIEYLE